MLVAFPSVALFLLLPGIVFRFLAFFCCFSSGAIFIKFSFNQSSDKSYLIPIRSALITGPFLCFVSHSALDHFHRSHIDARDAHSCAHTHTSYCVGSFGWEIIKRCHAMCKLKRERSGQTLQAARACFGAVAMMLGEFCTIVSELGEQARTLLMFIFFFIDVASAKARRKAIWFLSKQKMI